MPDYNQELDPLSPISELRIGLDGRMSIIAPARGAKPYDSVTCDFCPESRDVPPPYFQGELYSEAARRGIYATSNRFPILQPKEVIDRQANAQGSEDLRDTYGWQSFTSAYGRHLLVIDTDEHIDPFADSPDTGAYYKNLAWAYRKTLGEMRKEGFSWGAIGKNWNGLTQKGDVIRAGASKKHPHSHGIAANFPSRRLRERRQSLERLSSKVASWKGGHFQECSVCELSFRSLYTGGQIEERHPYFVSFVDPTPDEPPYDIQFKILSVPHISSFADMNDKQEGIFADILHKTMVKLGRLYPECGFNFALRDGFWYYQELDPRADHFQFDIYMATPENQRRQGIVPHIIGASVLPEEPEKILEKLKK